MDYLVYREKSGFVKEMQGQARSFTKPQLESGKKLIPGIFLPGNCPDLVHLERSPAPDEAISPVRVIQIID